MSESEKIVFQDAEETEYAYTDLIENQLTVISTMSELEADDYDTLTEDKIMAIANAMKIIHRSQKAILAVL